MKIVAIYRFCPNTQEHFYKLYYYCCVIRESDLVKAFVKGDLIEKVNYSVYSTMRGLVIVCYTICDVMFALVANDCGFCNGYFWILLPTEVLFFCFCPCLWCTALSFKRLFPRSSWKSSNTNAKYTFVCDVHEEELLASVNSECNRFVKCTVVTASPVLTVRGRNVLANQTQLTFADLLSSL